MEEAREICQCLGNIIQSGDQLRISLLSNDYLNAPQAFL